MDGLNIIKQEPVLLKICTGQADKDEIKQWADENEIGAEATDEVISMLTSAFMVGMGGDISGIASQEVETEVEHNDIDINKKLDNIVDEMTLLRSEVSELSKSVKTLIDGLKQRSDY